MRWLPVGLLIAGAAWGAVWPDRIGPASCLSRSPVTLAAKDRPLWDEYGLKLSEQAEYAVGAKHFTATAFRFQDSTGAFGAFEWQRPADSKPYSLADAAAEAPDRLLVVFNNYLILFDGWKPQLADLNLVLPRFPGVDQSPLPPVHLPAKGLAPNSERYVLGPVGLDQFEKGVPPAVAAFSMGAEVEIGQYDTPAGRMQLAVFSYPTPQIAVQRVQQFQSLPGAMAKRSGPLVAVILAPKDPNAAERLLSLLRYNAVVTEDERVPNARDNVGSLLLNIFMLTGILVAFCVVAGATVGLLRRLGWGTSGDPMTLLHLEDRSTRSSQP
jgi:hypothetical protein